MTFNVIAVVVVAALVFGAIGGAVSRRSPAGRGNEPKPLTVDPNQIDPVEQQYRDKSQGPEDAAGDGGARQLSRQRRQDRRRRFTWYEKALGDRTGRLEYRSARFCECARDRRGKERDAELQYQKVIQAQPRRRSSRCSAWLSCIERGRRRRTDERCRPTLLSADDGGAGEENFQWCAPVVAQQEHCAGAHGNSRRRPWTSPVRLRRRP